MPAWSLVLYLTSELPSSVLIGGFGTSVPRKALFRVGLVDNGHALRAMAVSSDESSWWLSRSGSCFSFCKVCTEGKRSVVCRLKGARERVRMFALK